MRCEKNRMTNRAHNVEACGIGIGAANVIFIGIVAYVLVLAIGLRALPSAEAAISDPWLMLMEVLILVLMPVLMLFVVAIHECADATGKAPGLCGVAFVSATAVITMSVHFILLTVGRASAMSSSPWWQVAFSFEWPSVVYALDILAWDVYFPLGMAFAAFAVDGTPTAPRLKFWMLVSGAIAFVGLAGVVTSDMMIRDIGILGYTLFLLPVTYLARRHFDELRSMSE